MKFNYEIVGDIEKEKENANLPTINTRKRSIAVNDDNEILVTDTSGNYVYAQNLTLKSIPPLSKEKFVKIIENIKDVKGRINRINEALNKNCDDNIYCPPSLESTLIDLLQILFNDKDNDWIGYYIFELDFGRKWISGKIVIGKEDIKLQTAEDLYDLLMQNKKR